MKKYQNKKNSGHVLITLLFFMIIATIITSSAAAILVSIALGTNKITQGIAALQVAESGVDEALIQLLRNPAYTGDTIGVNGGVATIQVSGSSPITIVSEGKLGNFDRKIRVTATYTSNQLTISSWQEVF